MSVYNYAPQQITIEYKCDVSIATSHLYVPPKIYIPHSLAADDRALLVAPGISSAYCANSDVE